MRIRTLIVDDEAPARARLRQFLKEETDFETVGECANGRQAVAAIQEQRPDLVFLDVQMPRLNGLEVCRALGDGPLPLVIFVTAYDRYALPAFEVHAIDYLLKPFDQERFRKSLHHAREQILRGQTQPLNERLLALLQDFRNGPQKLERLAFKSEGRVIFVRLADIDWIEAEGNYARLHVGAASHLLRETMNSLEGQLASDKFLRISRSVIVNLDRIKEVQPLFYGDSVVILRDGTKLNLTRNYREKLEALLVRQK
jgi:two-component system LytT family response regulator